MPDYAAYAEMLNTAQTQTIYVDIAGLSQDTNIIVADSEPALHVEYDAVRDQFAVRQATPEEVEEAAAAEAQAPAKSSSTAAADAAAAADAVEEHARRRSSSTTSA